MFYCCGKTFRSKRQNILAKDRDRLDRGSLLGISFDPSVLNRAEMWGKRSIHSIVNLQKRCMIISALRAGFRCNKSRLLTLEGKCSRRRAKPAHFGCHLPAGLTATMPL